ncbi:MAG: MgtC/SapB family protein [Hyphomicrobiaceae bacterium]
MLDSASITGLLVALGAGLLIGAERERRKGTGATRAPAGIRTFVIATLLGALSVRAGSDLLLAVSTAGVIALVGVSYGLSSREDPGLTTELALVACVPIGALSMREPAFAAAAAVVVAIILAAREPLHRFVRAVLSEQELSSARIFGAATLVVLPIIPNATIGPFNALNPYAIWLIVILLMAISSAGYIAVRLLGAGFGLPLAGFASGFVSSTATIAAMGARAKNTPELLAPAASGAILSTLATVVEMAVVLLATSAQTLAAMAGALLASGVAAAAYAAVFTFQAAGTQVEREPDQGQAFDLVTAVKLAGVLAAVILLCAAMTAWYGKAGVAIASAIGGFADTHAPAISVGQLVNANKFNPSDAIMPILLAMTANTITKAVVAYSSGGTAYALRVIPGLILVIAAAWLGSMVGPLLR